MKIWGIWRFGYTDMRHMRTWRIWQAGYTDMKDMAGWIYGYEDTGLWSADYNGFHDRGLWLAGQCKEIWAGKQTSCCPLHYLNTWNRLWSYRDWVIFFSSLQECLSHTEFAIRLNILLKTYSSKPIWLVCLRTCQNQSPTAQYITPISKLKTLLEKSS